MIGEKDDINLQVVEKKRVILGFYGLFYILILVLVIALGWFYLNNIDTFMRNKVTPFAKINDTVKTVDDVPMLKGTVSPPIDVTKESVPSPEKLSKGKTLFETTCSSCHGQEGNGDGVAGKSLNPPPRNFHDKNGWKNGQKFSQMYKTLQEGIPTTGMASFSTIPPQDRIAIILYIRTFTNDYPPVDQNELTELDKTYSLSAGVKQTSLIPIGLAEEKILKEDSASTAKIKFIVSKIKSDTSVKAAEQLKKISLDLNRSVAAFATNTKWNENEAEFVKFITTNPKNKGFKSSIIALSADEWSLLFNYVKSIF